jgi:hypothetical protein
MLIRTVDLVPKVRLPRQLGRTQKDMKQDKNMKHESILSQTEIVLILSTASIPYSTLQ